MTSCDSLTARGLPAHAKPTSREVGTGAQKTKPHRKKGTVTVEGFVSVSYTTNNNTHKAGTIGGGGATVEIGATNGNVTIRAQYKEAVRTAVRRLWQSALPNPTRELARTGLHGEA